MGSWKDPLGDTNSDEDLIGTGSVWRQGRGGRGMRLESTTSSVEVLMSTFMKHFVPPLISDVWETEWGRRVRSVRHPFLRPEWSLPVEGSPSVGCSLRDNIQYLDTLGVVTKSSVVSTVFLWQYRHPSPGLGGTWRDRRSHYRISPLTYLLLREDRYHGAPLSPTKTLMRSERTGFTHKFPVRASECGH